MFQFQREGSTYQPTMFIDLNQTQWDSIEELKDSLLEDDDVEEVYTNARLVK